MASGSISISIGTLNQRVSSSSTFGSKMTQFTIGTREFPRPIHMEMKPIFEALDKKYWPSDVYDSYQIGQRKEALRQAYLEYPKLIGRIAQGKFHYYGCLEVKHNCSL